MRLSVLKQLKTAAVHCGEIGKGFVCFFCFFWRENTDNFPQFKLTNSLQLNSSRTLNLFRFKKILISFFARYVYTNKFNIAILHQVREDPDRWRMTFSWFLAKKKRIFYYNNDWCEFFCAVIESRLNSSNLHEPTDWLVCLNLCTKNNTRNVIIISFVIQPAQSRAATAIRVDAKDYGTFLGWVWRARRHHTVTQTLRISCRIWLLLLFFFLFFSPQKKGTQIALDFLAGILQANCCVHKDAEYFKQQCSSTTFTSENVWRIFFGVVWEKTRWKAKWFINTKTENTKKERNEQKKKNKTRTSSRSKDLSVTENCWVKTAATCEDPEKVASAWLLAASINLSLFFVVVVFSLFLSRPSFLFLDMGPHFATTSQTRIYNG